jgi:twitching motility protein PilT
MSSGPTLFGRLAVERGFVSQEQIDLCLRVQAQLGGRHHLGALMVHRGFITEEQLRELLRLQQAAQAQADGQPARPSAAGPPRPGSGPGLAGVPQPGAPEHTPRPPPQPSPLSNPQLPSAGASARILSLLEAAERRGASDIHFHPGCPIALRQGGRLLIGSNAPLDPAELEGQLIAVLTPEQRAQLEREHSLDVLLATPTGLRCRGSFYKTHTGLNATFRLVRRGPSTLEQLGLPAQLASFTNYGQGMVLVTGLAGSGKSTTLAALVDLINGERAEHVLCLEDPVEILHPAKKALINQRQVGRDTGSFARALRGALREDPDVIVIGELRDAETIALAVTAAETGHLVLGSMNTASSARAVSRILGAFPPSQQTQVRSMVSESLHGVITQRLLPAIDGSRALALELLVVTPAIANLIREDKMFQLRSAMQTGKAAGMRTMDESLRELVLAGRVAPDEARRVAESPQTIPNGPGAPGGSSPGAAAGKGA